MKIKTPSEDHESDEKNAPKDMRALVVRARAFSDPKEYLGDKHLDPAALPFRSTTEMVEAAKAKKITVQARIMASTPAGRGFKKAGTAEFIRMFESQNEQKRKIRFREWDSFGWDNGSSLVGQDFVPLLGGPFNKQQYLQDYLQAQVQCFFAMHHDPVARAVCRITRDFTLGRGFKVTAKTDTGQAIWNAFERANKLQERFQAASFELSGYGEIMWWWLPRNETKIAYQVKPGQEPAKSIIPRVRLLDPSSIWEIVTFPEDIERVLNYTLVFPTQYQIYSGVEAGKSVPGSKWIYQQIPADEIFHYKVNVVSNEKRGRSDLFPAIGYLKRLRDSVTSETVRTQKQSAWGIDTTIDGNDGDMRAYAQSQKALGTIPQDGSEFIHSTKVKREMLEPKGMSSGSTSTFEWNLSMVSMATGLPVHWFGTHLSNATTKASAMTATEPVIKMMENRREVYRRMIQDMGCRLFKMFGITDSVDVTFPELVAQDRGAKLKDLALCEEQKWLSQERCAKIAAKEMGVDDFDWEKEKADIAKNEPVSVPPLGSPGALGSSGGMGASGRGGKSGDIDADANEAEAEPKERGVSGDDRREERARGLRL